MSNFRPPPNKTNLLFASKALPPRALMTNLAKLGLTAEDLKPVDWRKTGLSPVLNQQQCGNCWAMSSTSCLTDKFIVNKKISDILLQPIVTTLCVDKSFNPNWFSQGCNGGFPEEAVRFFEAVGVPKVDSSCPSPKELIKQTMIQATCSGLKQQCGSVLYKAKPNSLRFLSVGSNTTVDPKLTIVNIQRELMNGPVIGAFKVFADFMYSKNGKIYKWDLTNGIYVHGAGYENEADSGSPPPNTEDGGHAVEIVGWDTGNAGKYGRIPYWIIKNSWTTVWMDGGYGKIAMTDVDKRINVDVFLDVSRPTGNPEYPYEGGMIAFDIDHNSGDKSGYVGDIPLDKTFVSSNTNSIIMIVLLAVIIVVGLFFFIRHRRRA